MYDVHRRNSSDHSFRLQVGSKLNQNLILPCLIATLFACESTTPSSLQDQSDGGALAGTSMDGMSDGGEVTGGEIEAGESCQPSSTGLSSEVELCDEVDNDCDGEVDEGFDELGTVCERRLMRCVSMGVQVCGPDGDLTCNAPMITTGDEVCDDIDNDCDGDVDEGINLLIDRQNCGSCGNVCEWDNGLGRCEMGACVLTSCLDGYLDQNGDASDGCECRENNEELCDEIDNDCDGIVDEGFSTNTTCTIGQGACMVSGLLACVSEDLAACQAIPLDPSDEICDGLDNDCDGLTDEGFDGDGDGVSSCEQCSLCVMSGEDCPEFCELNDCNDEQISISPLAWDQCEDQIDQNCDGIDAPCTEAYARATALSIVSATNSAGTCPDINGDGVGDNAFGLISGIANPATQQYIDRYNMNIMIGAYQFDPMRPDMRFNLSVLLGTYYRNTNPPRFLLKRSNYDETGRPRMRFPYGQIRDGQLSAGPGTFVFSVPLQGADGQSVVVEVPIEQAYIRGTFTLNPEDNSQFSLSNGLVSGYINKQNLEDSFVLLDPPIVRVIQSLITPDLDLNQDGEPDYYSICLLTTLTGVDATVEEEAPTP